MLVLDFRIQDAGEAGEKPMYGSQSQVPSATPWPLGIRKSLGNILGLTI